MALVIHYKNFGNILQMGNSSRVTHHFLCAAVIEDVREAEYSHVSTWYYLHYLKSKRRL